jgi:hypothetical protein
MMLLRGKWGPEEGVPESMVKLALASALSAIPDLKALAFTVAEPVRVKGVV